MSSDRRQQPLRSVSHPPDRQRKRRYGFLGDTYRQIPRATGYSSPFSHGEAEYRNSQANTLSIQPHFRRCEDNHEKIPMVDIEELLEDSVRDPDAYCASRFEVRIVV